tara:strand:+ start:35625 stop:36197 length:573 start_codon:yes stop_codon:yes gene_type:complete
MLKSGINQCWSTPIYKTQITLDQCEELVQEILLSTNIMKPQAEYDSGSLTDKIPLLKDLAIEKYSEFFKEVFSIDLNDMSYEFSSWLTGSQKGYSMNIHNHSGAQFAAVFYVLSDDIDKGGELVSYDPRANANRGYFGKTAEMFKPIEYAPKTGDVIIMPGYVYHLVKTYHSNLRLAVPVDIFIKQKKSS